MDGFTHATPDGGGYTRGRWRRKRDDRAGLVLSGHMDVVPADTLKARIRTEVFAEAIPL